MFVENSSNLRLETIHNISFLALSSRAEIMATTAIMSSASAFVISYARAVSLSNMTNSTATIAG